MTAAEEPAYSAVSSLSRLYLTRAPICTASAWDEPTQRQVRLARDTGALEVLPIVLTNRAIAHILAGELAAAASPRCGPIAAWRVVAGALGLVAYLPL
jgi:hypothetical protein